MIEPTNQETLEFLKESNKIEREYSKEALADAVQAWTMACLACKNDFSIEYFLGIHKRLMKRLNPCIAGKIRDCVVYIGGNKKVHLKEDIKLELEELVDSWNNNKKILMNKRKQDKENFIKRWHILFEYCHCFEDGNGRTRRILMNIQRITLGLPLLIIHEGKEQVSYYEWFKEDKND